MTQTTEQILSSIRALPRNEREELLMVAGRENDKRTWQGSTREEVAAITARFRKAQAWIDLHKEEYDGQWVCLYGDQLIAHGFDGLEVFEKAKALGIKSPFLERIKAFELPFGGW